MISDLNGEKIAASFYEKKLQKASQENFRIEKVLKRKGDELYTKWKRDDNSVNSSINKKTFNEFPPYKNESILC